MEAQPHLAAARDGIMFTLHKRREHCGPHSGYAHLFKTASQHPRSSECNASLLTFLLIAFAVTWTCWIAVIIIPFRGVLRTVVFLTGVFAPSDFFREFQTSIGLHLSQARTGLSIS